MLVANFTVNSGATLSFRADINMTEGKSNFYVHVILLELTTGGPGVMSELWQQGGM